MRHLYSILVVAYFVCYSGVSQAQELRLCDGEQANLQGVQELIIKPFKLVIKQLEVYEKRAMEARESFESTKNELAKKHQWNFEELEKAQYAVDRWGSQGKFLKSKKNKAESHLRNLQDIRKFQETRFNCHLAQNYVIVLVMFIRGLVGDLRELERFAKHRSDYSKKMYKANLPDVRKYHEFVYFTDQWVTFRIEFLKLIFLTIGSDTAKNLLETLSLRDTVIVERAYRYFQDLEEETKSKAK